MWIVSVLVQLVVVLPTAFIAVTCFRPGIPGATRPEEVERAAAGLKGYYRQQSSTYLTLPEWYIVYSRLVLQLLARHGR